MAAQFSDFLRVGSAVSLTSEAALQCCRQMFRIVGEPSRSLTRAMKYDRFGGLSRGEPTRTANARSAIAYTLSGRALAAGKKRQNKNRHRNEPTPDCGFPVRCDKGAAHDARKSVHGLETGGNGNGEHGSGDCCRSRSAAARWCDPRHHTAGGVTEPSVQISAAAVQRADAAVAGSCAKYGPKTRSRRDDLPRIRTACRPQGTDHWRRLGHGACYRNCLCS